MVLPCIHTGPPSCKGTDLLPVDTRLVPLPSVYGPGYGFSCISGGLRFPFVTTKVSQAAARELTECPLDTGRGLLSEATDITVGGFAVIHRKP